MTSVALSAGCGTGSASTSGDSASGVSTGSAGTGGASGDGGSGSVSSGGSAPSAGPDATVTPFEKAPMFFGGGTDKRHIDATAKFPEVGAYTSVTLHLALTCPAGGCDPWDRVGSLGVVREEGATTTVIEIARFVTPYHVGAAWDFDVTDLRPLLTGEVKLRAFIDTWVGPNIGWEITTSFTMKGGIPAKLPVAVVPLWSSVSVPYGDPAKPIAASASPQAVKLPAGSAYALRSFITGHGQGNAGNCAEFCSREHTITAGKVAHKQTIWREDCATTAAPNQQGTFKYPRAGWCPGADVRPWSFDVTQDLAGSAEATFAYDVAAYENTCRPEAKPCAGCTLGTGCAYDNGAHTEPFYSVSTLLIAYR